MTLRDLEHLLNNRTVSRIMITSGIPAIPELKLSRGNFTVIDRHNLTETTLNRVVYSIDEYNGLINIELGD